MSRCAITFTPEFVKRVNELAEKTGAVLIADEITVGFRKTTGSMAEMLGYKPDIIVFSKAISNGIPFAAILGKREVMDVCQSKTFISSTSWSDRTGFCAALATMEKMERKDVPKHLCRVGAKVAKGWKKFAKLHNLKVNVHDEFEPIPCFSFDYGDQSKALDTLFTQEMLQRGYISSTKGFYATYAHKAKHIKAYLIAVDEVFGVLEQAINENTVLQRLKGGVAHDGFRRLVN